MKPTYLSSTTGSESDRPHIFISAAEPSADLHASALIRAVRELNPEVQFSGVAGPKMQAAGCQAIYDMTAHSAMLTAVVGHLHHGFQMLSKSWKELRSKNFRLVVVVDSPLINLSVARLARIVGVPVLYYIAPQLWAWGSRVRIHRVRARVDRLACIFPFEEPYFRAYGLDASYVGHPLFASLRARRIDHGVVAGLQRGPGHVLAIMPGSRRHVAAENFPGQLQVAQQLTGEFPDLRILVSVANEQVKPTIEQALAGVDCRVELHQGDNAALLSAADLALVASGTATLEAAYYGTPMIVMYNSSRLYQLVRWIIETPYFSLPNILADRELVPEFMPYYNSIVPIVRSARDLLKDDQARVTMASKLQELIQPFLNTTASETTAKIILDMVESRYGESESV